jgi:hypothetical protein
MRRRGRVKVDTADEFWALVDKRGPDECWPWMGPINIDGYGAGMNMTAHRKAFSLHHGREIPKGAWICHHCDNPPCCNPAHLYEGDRRTNMRDQIDRGRLFKSKYTFKPKEPP